MAFGEGLLNKGKAKKREKRPLTQIEIMAAVEREKQEKKAARRAAKVRASPIRLPSQHETRASDFRDFSPFFCFSERHFVSLCPFVKSPQSSLHATHLAASLRLAVTARGELSGSQG